MIAALSKPVDQITGQDLIELTQRKWPESENVEYERELSRTARNQEDPWYTPAETSVELRHGAAAYRVGSVPSVLLGPYSIGDRDVAMSLLARDINEACGVPGTDALEVGWASLATS